MYFVVPIISLECFRKIAHSYTIATQYRFQWKRVFIKLTTFFIPRTKQNYTKSSITFESTRKIFILLSTVFEILLISVVICKQRLLHDFFHKTFWQSHINAKIKKILKITKLYFQRAIYSKANVYITLIWHDFVTLWVYYPYWYSQILDICETGRCWPNKMHLWQILLGIKRSAFLR